MACLGPGNYVVILPNVGGSKASYIKLVLKREPRTSKAWFLVGSILSHEEYVDVVVLELHEVTGLTLTLDVLALLSINPARVSLPEAKHQLFYVLSAFFRPRSSQLIYTLLLKLMQAITTHSTINP
jgi:hypothetical protein